MKIFTKSTFFVLSGVLSFNLYYSQAGVGPTPYCMPAYSSTPCNQPNPSNTAGNFVNDFIDDFNTTGAVNNIVNNGSGCQSQVLSGATQNYFYFACPTFLRVNAGQTVNINLKSGITYAQGFAVYIDWNNDNTFALSEQVCATPGVPAAASVVPLSFTIPGGQALGTYRLRVRSAYFTNGTTIDPCISYTFGEAEDYNMVIGPGVCSPLPIELTAIHATRREENIEISWVTATEKNSDYFTIEKSFDNKSYSTLARIPAAGNSSTEKMYIAYDKPNAHQKLTYYKLKQYDKAGIIPSFEKTITYYNNPKNADIILYPNPSKDLLSISLPEFLTSGNFQVEVFDKLGKRVISKEVGTFGLTADLNVSELKPGTYLLKVTTWNEKTFQKIFLKSE